MIHNDHSRGSINLFTPAQLSLFDDIIHKADAFFLIEYPESKRYEIGISYTQTPIYLIPYDQFEEFQRSKCRRMFERMNELYQKERQILLSGCSPEEKEHLERMLRKKYFPWSVCGCECYKCQWKFWTDNTPLGYFDPARGEVCICLDKIINLFPAEVDAISAKVIVHELAHAIMYNPSHPYYLNNFEKWVEESLANKIALKYMSVASALLLKPNLYTSAAGLVSRQPEEYKLGQFLYDNNLSDWYLLQQNKPNLNEGAESQWLIYVKEPVKDIVKIQEAFYRSMNIPACSTSPSSMASYEAWLVMQPNGKGGTLDPKSSVKRYAAFASSKTMGTALKALMGWSYDCLYDCKSSIEVKALLNIIEKTGEGKEFHLAAYGGAKASVTQYLNYLISIGL